MNRQKKILLSLFALLLLALVYAYVMMPKQNRVEFESRVGSTTQPKTQAPGIEKNRLRLDLLETEPTRYKGADRDLFNFVVVQKKPEPKPLPVVAPKVIKPVQPLPPPPAVNLVVRQQLARFTFLGFLLKDSVHTVFLSRGEELFLVQEGDQFGDENQFTAVSISPERMRIRQSGDVRFIDIQLIEKEALVPSYQQP